MAGQYGSQPKNGYAYNLNTKLYTSYSDNSMLVVGAWNTQISIKLHPFKGMNADGIRQYAQDTSEIISTSLTQDNTYTLLDAIKTHILPAIAEKKSAKVSVTMGADSNKKVFSILTDGNNVLLEIAVNVSEDNKAPDNSVLTHIFKKKEYLVNYDPSSGSAESVSSNSDFQNFVNKLEDISVIGSPACAHSINYSNGLKANMSNKSSYSGGYNNNTASTGYQAPTLTVDDSLDFLPV